MDQDPAPRRIEDDLADSIANLWHDLDEKAAAEKTAERQKDEDLILTWALKLADILKGRHP